MQVCYSSKKIKQNNNKVLYKQTYINFDLRARHHRDVDTFHFRIVIYDLRLSSIRSQSVVTVVSWYVKEGLVPLVTHMHTAAV